MGIHINHDTGSARIANVLQANYADLTRSTRNLASGMRVNSAADDAAGLAIRELFRTDIAAINQGIRNANDAISMLQVHDGALGVIDEKLIRMKELAEQAATGTYNSTQRGIINNEFQAMADEIERIALATEFNTTKLLCQDPTNKLVDEDVPRYFVLNADTTAFHFAGAPASSLEILNPGAVNGPMDLAFRNSFLAPIVSYEGDANIELWSGTTNDLAVGTTITLHYNAAANQWSVLDGPADAVVVASQADRVAVTFNAGTDGISLYSFEAGIGPFPWQISDENGPVTSTSLGGDVTVTLAGGHWPDHTGGTQVLDRNGSYPDAKVVGDPTWAFGSSNREVLMTFNLDLDGDGGVDAIQTFTQRFNNDVAQADGAFYILSFDMRTSYKTKIHFGPGNNSAEDYYYVETFDCTRRGLGIDMLNTITQDAAQHALAGVDAAIVRKDQIRSYFGAMQNRFENTITNLTIQSENMQAAESRISDTDVAREMTDFVRSQILAQTGVAMLGQASDIRRMMLRALQL